MKFPSVSFLLEKSADAFLRFPLVICSATVAVSAGIYLIEFENTLGNPLPVVNLLLAGYLGVPMFLAARIFIDSRSRNEQLLWGLRIIVALLLVAIYFYLPGDQESLNPQISYIRYAIFAIAAHLLVAFCGYLSSNNLNGFWNFNKTLFLRFLLSALYAAVLYLGIIFALWAFTTLFKIDVHEELYVEIWIVITGFFNTWFFVAGIPKDFQALDLENDYPNGLKTFILYVLIPLMSLYFIILYSYSVKVVFLWDWPEGIMTYMIIAVAVVGILSMLLAYPYSLSTGQDSLKFLQKGYYILLVPLLVMLFLAIGIRISDYGITINRYITVLLGVWLTFISFYLIFIGRNIRIIPISLFILILLTSFGNWGIFSVSERSQVKRLQMILESEEILVGKIQNEPIWVTSDTAFLKFENELKNEGVLSDSIHNEVYSILNYLEDYHGFAEIDEWFDQNPRQIAEAHDMGEAWVYMKMMGLNPIYKNEYKDGNNYYFSTNNKGQFTSIKGYDYMLEIAFNDYDEALVKDIEEGIPGLKVTNTRSQIILTREGFEDVNISVSDIYDSLVLEQDGKQSKVYSQEQLQLYFNSSWIQGRCTFESLNGDEQVNYYQATVFIKQPEMK
ncbi:MAG: hypothetical protein ACI83W_000411 [Marinoscillum sp.]|jgi:hypothetical protein